MRALFVAIVISVGASSHAAPTTRAGGSATQAYRAVRAECKKPGKRITALMAAYFARWLSPQSFGARVVHGWEDLTAEQRAKTSLQRNQPEKRDMSLSIEFHRQVYIAARCGFAARD